LADYWVIENTKSYNAAYICFDTDGDGHNTNSVTNYKVSFTTSKSKCTYFVSYSSVLSLLLSWPVTDFPSLIKMATRTANPNNGVFWMGNKTLKVPMTLFAQNRRRLVEALKKDTGLLPNSIVLLQGGQYTFHHWGADYLLTKFWT
jgi:hypothetical protein